MKHTFRYDSRPWKPGQKTLAQWQAGKGNGAYAARRRMLARMGLTKEDKSAATARDRMIRRGQTRTHTSGA